MQVSKAVNLVNLVAKLVIQLDAVHVNMVLSKEVIIVTPLLVEDVRAFHVEVGQLDVYQAVEDAILTYTKMFILWSQKQDMYLLLVI
jgi:hypothetical protein